jgi:hypothetical protein
VNACPDDLPYTPMPTGAAHGGVDCTFRQQFWTATAASLTGVGMQIAFGDDEWTLDR